MRRCRVEVFGLVQGVGFRPFVYRLAVKYRLTGLVSNTRGGVVIEIQGNESENKAFLNDLVATKPEASVIESLRTTEIPLQSGPTFRIVPSLSNGPDSTAMPHDLAPCNECIQEMLDRQNRRYRYPFITCNDCGPRFTIAEDLPFDRQNTAMLPFVLCATCELEYGTPENRRFHAQTISCPSCGPQLAYHNHGKNFASEEALSEAVRVINAFGIIGVKGVGGYQLVCLARSSAAIKLIRQFKNRMLKPFAVMAPGISSVESLCVLNTEERHALVSGVAPIVLLYRKCDASDEGFVCNAVAPSIPTLGVMLPSSPLHHLLARDTGEWLLVTSANRRGDPMITDDDEARRELAGIADGILYHNRQIVHLADDSVVRVAGAQRIVLRHARGLAPTEIRLDGGTSCGIGYGGDSKAAFAIHLANRCILGQHLGDLESRRACAVFEKERKSFEKIYGLDARNAIVACDTHSSYGSNRLALQRTDRVEEVYHHHAHLESLIAEKTFSGKALGAVCDGTGLGPDGSIWGGEFFLVDGKERRRVGSLLPFRLVGGEAAIKDLRRIALGMLYETYGEKCFNHPFVTDSFTIAERSLLEIAFERSINTPYTSSLGRLFDGLAALVGLLSASDYEAQAPMALEALARDAQDAEPLPVRWLRDSSGLWRWDWRNIVPFALEACSAEGMRCRFSAAFHATVVKVAHDLALQFDSSTVLLTGGVFQNAALVKLFQEILPSAGLAVICHNRIPPGDGGLALGQVAATLRREKEPCASVYLGR